MMHLLSLFNFGLSPLHFDSSHKKPTTVFLEMSPCVDIHSNSESSGNLKFCYERAIDCSRGSPFVRDVSFQWREGSTPCLVE